jgi:hypothetical protein
MSIRDRNAALKKYRIINQRRAAKKLRGGAAAGPSDRVVDKCGYDEDTVTDKGSRKGGPPGPKGE